MDKASTSISRRLHHLFLKKPTSTTALVTSITDGKFEDLVDRFKKGSSSSGFRGKRMIYKVTVQRLARAGHFSYIHDIINHQKQYPDIENEHFTARLICLYGHAKMLDHALQLFDEMPNLNCPRTVLSFNALMAACLASGQFHKGIELFEELPGKLSIEPNVISYTTAIKAFCKMGLLDKAVAMLEEMERNNVVPNAITFYTLLTAFYSVGRFSEGEKIWGWMQDKNVVPHLKCYNSRMHGLVNDKRYPEAIEVFTELEEKALKPNSYSYNVLIKGFVAEGNIEEAKKWYAKMLESDCAPDFFTFMTLITFACSNNDGDFAFELCKKSLGVKKRISSKIMQIVVNELVENSKVEKAKELLDLVNSTRGWEHGKLTLPAAGE